VNCPTADPILVGGGFSNLSGIGSFPIFSAPTAAGNGWQASAQVNSGSVQVQVFAICAAG